MVQGIEREFEQGDVCLEEESVPEPECVTVSTDFGLRSYEAPGNGRFFDIGFRNDDGIYSTVYGKCKRYKTRNARDGFWRDLADDILGPAFSVASWFGTLSTIIGTSMWIFLWIACCVAFPVPFWFVCTGLFTLSGVFMFLTLLFTLSDVCTTQGCSLGYAALCAILAGSMWFATAGVCCKVALLDKANVYKPVAFDIVITEYAQPDGTVLTEKVTTRSNGTSVVERTTQIKKQVDDENSTHLETGVMASPDIGTRTNQNSSDSAETSKDDIKKEK